MNITNQIDLCFFHSLAASMFSTTWVYLVLLTQEWLSKEKTGRRAWPTWSASEYHFQQELSWMLKEKMNVIIVVDMTWNIKCDKRRIPLPTTSISWWWWQSHRHNTAFFFFPLPLDWVGPEDPNDTFLIWRQLCKRSKWYFWKPDYFTRKSNDFV